MIHPTSLAPCLRYAMPLPLTYAPPSRASPLALAPAAAEALPQDLFLLTPPTPGAPSNRGHLRSRTVFECRWQAHRRNSISVSISVSVAELVDATRSTQPGFAFATFLACSAEAPNPNELLPNKLTKLDI